MGNLKPGDRVRVYGGVQNTVGKWNSIGTCTVTNDGETFEIKDAYGCLHYAHPKQCRRLVKRRRRRVWIHREAVGHGGGANVEWKPCSDAEFVEFVEVKPKRKETP